jgi:hypothetical protein
MHGKKLAWVICVAMSVASMQGQEQSTGKRARTAEPALGWLSASGGGIPAGAVAYGAEADGRELFACRGPIGGGIHLGKIASGFTGCNVGYGGREITLPNYEVLAHPQKRAAIAAGSMSVAERPRISATAERSTVSATDRTTLSGSAMAASTRIGATPILPPAFQPIPPSPPDATTKRGFDENGEPYVDVRLADGTIKRSQARGVTLIKPDGTTQFIPHGFIYSNAPMPTPPELPDDPTSGRAWVERHNSQLLDVISTLVRRDEAEMKKFGDAENKSTGGDVFAQIVYRTRVAAFLAQER